MPITEGTSREPAVPLDVEAPPDAGRLAPPPLGGPSSGWLSAAESEEYGRDLRERVPHAAHAAVVHGADRPTVEMLLAARNEHRVAELVPLAHRRMSRNAFAFLRGSAGLMADDLAAGPTTGLLGQICGDAHAANFGLYGTHDGRIVMDINDFDETVVGPWEWDLKRLAVSVVLASRVAAGADARVARATQEKAARHVARAYRRACRHLSRLPFLTSWTALGDEAAIARADADELLDDFATASADATQNTSERLALRITHRHGDERWHFVPDPPILTNVVGSEREGVLASLPEYVANLRRSHGRLIGRYRAHDVAHRIVGTGSVGLRSYLVLLQGNGDEALVLQLKQATSSALAPYVAPQEDPHQGRRIVLGARLVQAETDPLYGWTTVDGAPFTVRQFRNRKGSIDVTALRPDHLDDYGRLAGALLARAHSRSIDPRVLAAYLADGKEFDRAIAAYALAYATVVEADHRSMVEAIAAGVLPAADTLLL